MDIVVGTDIRDGNGTTRMVNWCGCIIQDPHPSVRALGFLPEEGHGVYVARYTIIVTAFQGRLQLHNNWYSIIYLFCTKVVLMLCIDGAKGARCIDMAFMLFSG